MTDSLKLTESVLELSQNSHPELFLLVFLIETICFDPSSEPSDQDGSDEGSQHIF